ncbi:TRAP transporter substrate-binding protein [Cocleimonas sp. KMM 6892]|uniref:TRAP transporter substrate-binding protein n=1 Tax=unclassified Cocleimonas TaxID=2639732 RepID=UPI002DBDDCA7|nr:MULTISPECIES: TRAP transporter substrate-binding protein [unclassified Cocleimonas]MEB8432720.1 TRAP transporter substrate-binding protein [Cocleimonas sp. KMM 6892]MEC4715579.1 TRAP transporter substrate-binding protein [Cocleimonas sp. KMM 6895]MEC4744803.1 TRAP transporter substrate-binding protein [Cocleimonas sp. KMM 6896]
MIFKKQVKTILKTALVGVVLSTFVTSVSAETLRGASMFDDKHTFTKTMVKFADLVNEYYDGDVKFDLRLNGELGVEKDYVTFLNQGVAIDYTILAPSNMARFAPSIPLMDMPFLFRDLDHWNTVLSSDILAPLEKELSEKADIVIVGYAGGGTRNLLSNKPIMNMKELEGHKMRVMGAPIQAQIFDAIGAAPSAIAYNEVYNAIQTGVINGFENEAASIQNLKFYEVAPNVTLTSHTITVRPIVFSGKSFRKLPEKLQAAIKKAGKEAGAYGRELESREDGIKLKEMVDAGQIKVSEFEGREKLLDMVKPVQDKFAAGINATELLGAIRATK